MSFNPFNIGPHENLSETHLINLVEKGVSEGYFVEYKRQPPSVRAITKSIASLANTYGGWYIIGITTDANNVATGVPGFSATEMSDPIMAIRDSCISGISPTPNMRIHVVALRNGNIAVAVNVPDGQHTPFICTDGRVYRRSQDASEPVHENNRSAFDLIVKRGAKNDKAFDQFCKDSRTFSQSEHKIWLNLFFSPYPDRSVILDKLHDHSWGSELLSRSLLSRSIVCSEDPVVSGNLPFDTIMPSGDTLILKQTKGQDFSVNKLSMCLDTFGRCKLHIPVQSFEFANLTGVSQSLMAAIANKVYATENVGGLLEFIDIGPVLLTTMAALSYYKEVVSEFGVLNQFRFRASANDLWRTVPLVDSGEWCTHINKHGLPVNMYSKVSVPDATPGGYIIDGSDQFWIGVIMQITELFGLPSKITIDAMFEIIKQAQNRAPK